MNRLGSIISGLFLTALTLASAGCGNSVPSNYSGGYSPVAQSHYVPRPIPSVLPEFDSAAPENLVLYRRSAWTPEPPVRYKLKMMGRIDKITIHHEGNPYPYTQRDPRAVAEELRRIRAAHMRRMKAGDIGYHYIIDPAGRIWEGRSIRYQGAHVRGHNPGNLGIMLLGNFQIQEPTPEQLKTLNAFLKIEMKRYGITPNHVYGHRDLVATQCPGDNLYNKLQRLPCLRPGGSPADTLPAIAELTNPVNPSPRPVAPVAHKLPSAAGTSVHPAPAPTSSAPTKPPRSSKPTQPVRTRRLF